MHQPATDAGRPPRAPELLLTRPLPHLHHPFSALQRAECRDAGGPRLQTRRPHAPDAQHATARTLWRHRHARGRRTSTLQRLAARAAAAPPLRAGGRAARPVHPHHSQHAQRVQRQLSDEDLQAAHPIMALLQTLMPWVSLAGEAAEVAGRSQEDLLRDVPGLTEFLAESGVDLTQQVPAAERPRVLELVRDFLVRHHGPGGGA